jgi:diguanylate cyclase (GGDEF)-like protein
MRILVVDLPTDAPMLTALAAHGELTFASLNEGGSLTGRFARARADVMVVAVGSWHAGLGGALPPETRPPLVLAGAAPLHPMGQAAIADADEWIAEGAGALEIGARLRAAVTRARVRRRALRRGAIDPLTDLPNRRGVIVALLRGAARSRRQGAHLSLVLIDLDHFKRINEEQGHDGGDRVLRRVGRVLRRATRQDEVCGRIGGDEFAVVVCGDAQHADLVFQRIRAALNGEGVSATGAAQELGPTESLRELYRRVDMQLRARKAEVRSSPPGRG